MTTNTGAGVVQRGYEDAGLCAVGQTVTTAQMSRGLDRLNDIINFEATQGLKLWLQQDIAIPLTVGQGVYTLGPGGSVNMAKPLQVLQGYFLTSQAIRQPLSPLSRDEFTRLSQIAVLGAINSYFVDKALLQFNISFWNTPDATAATGTGHLICRVAAPNLVVSADNVQFPPEWTIFLRWAVADEVCAGQSEAIQSRCAQKCSSYRDALQAFDVEDAPTTFSPDMRSQGGRFR